MNQFEISTDGVNVYYIGKVCSGKGSKVIGAILLCALFFGFSALILAHKHSDLYSFGLITSIVASVFSIAMGKYLLWNIYGEEFLSINTKSIKKNITTVL